MLIWEVYRIVFLTFKTKKLTVIILSSLRCYKVVFNIAMNGELIITLRILTVGTVTNVLVRATCTLKRLVCALCIAFSGRFFCIFMNFIEYLLF